MFRKILFAMCILTTLSLPTYGLTLAAGDLPTWETAFDPGPYMNDEGYFINAVEEYKGSLYAVAGTYVDAPLGQVFGSPDGKNWQPASNIGFGLGAVEDGCGLDYYDTSWDMIVFQDRLYVLPFEWCYLRPGVILRSTGTPAHEGMLTWETSATTQELGFSWVDGDTVYYGQFHKLAVFNDMLYASVDYADPTTLFTGSAIFRSPSGAPGTWTAVKDFPGWGWPGTFQQFKGALYVASDGIYIPPDWEPAPEQIWRTYDGVNWEMVVGDGFGNPGSDGLGGFADYKGYLYVGATSNGDDIPVEGGPIWAQLWRSTDGKQWEPVAIQGLGSFDQKIDGLVVYQGELYAHTVAMWGNGCSVFRTKDAKTWERVNEPGWGNIDYWASHHTADQVVFKDELYMGVYGWNGVLLKMAHPD